ncbi:YbbR-like domain-containing protein [Abyssisolibacter fermentans]|uniref:CdaR family protein n=1 Tax=Abyssisolibacter fermentans TaxID=1766203 RepID=UPI000834ED9A|nr:CdaR family protein [Abyssisolibacter fermentans]
MKNKKKGNVPIKILAAIFAIILWVYVMNEVNPKIIKEIPNIKVNYLGEETLKQANIVLMEPKEATVTVKISGRRDQILNIGEKDIYAEVDLVGYREGENKIPIKVINPANVEEIVDFYPKEILFKLDEMVEKQLPVTIYTKGKCKEGYITGSARSKPNDVLLKGPSSWVNSVDKVVATVNLNNAEDDIKVNVPITVLNNKGKEVSGVEKNPNHVDITIPVLKTKKVPIDLNLIGEALDGYEITNITLDPNSVTVKGKAEIIDSISTITTEEINVKDIATSKTLNDIRLILPTGVSLLEDKEFINVKINVEQIKSKKLQYTTDEIKIKNLGEGLEVRGIVAKDGIEITVEGVESMLDYISRKYITPYIDVLNLEEGDFTIELKADDLYKIKVVDVNPKTVNISLAKIEEESTINEEGNSETEEILNNNEPQGEINSVDANF